MSIGFKEWALICRELDDGRQSLILRKGGIAEGRAGFRFQHDDFLLIPTLFHEQVVKLKLPESTPLPETENGTHTICNRVLVEWTRDLTDWQQVKRLDAFHLWRENVIRELFEYDGKQKVSLAFVRVFKLEAPVSLADEPRFGGCRSWVALPDVEGMKNYRPVLDDQAHRRIESQVLAALEG
jgi:hypothetical protein